MKKAKWILICVAFTWALAGCNRAPVDARPLPVSWTRSFAGTVPTESFPRPLPLESLAISKVINASDFGAIPDDGRCDVDAIVRAIRALKDSPNTKLVFKKGTYNLQKSSDDSKLNEPVFKISGLMDAQIDFGGSLLQVNRSNSAFMEINGCKNLILENLEVDYSPLPYTVGRVVRVSPSEGFFDMQILAGYLQPDDRHFLDVLNDPSRLGDPTTRTWGYFLDRKHPGRMKENLDNVYFSKNIEKLAENIFRYHIKAGTPGGRLDGVEEGDLFNYMTRCGDGFLFRESEQVTLRNVTIYTCGAANFSGTYNDCLNFLGCRIKIRDGRFKSSNADGFIFHSSIFAPWIENCLAEGMSDDCVNIQIRPNFIVAIVDARTLKLCKEGGIGIHPKDYAVGDEIQFFNGETGRGTMVARVTGVRPQESVVMFDRDLVDLKPGMDKIRNTTLYNPSLSMGAVIRNNHFRNARRHGVILRTHDALVEGNTFEGLSSDAITIHNETPWPEGLFAKNILIRNNQFIHCGFERDCASVPFRANLSIFCYELPRPFGYFAHENIVIENNRFEGWRNRAMYVANAKNVRIENNEIGEPVPSGVSSMNKEASVIVSNAENIRIENNRFPVSVAEKAIEQPPSGSAPRQP